MASTDHFMPFGENRRAIILAKITEICDFGGNADPIAIAIGIF